MKSILTDAAAVTLSLLLLPATGFAQDYPHYPYDYRPGAAGIMGIGPGGREAYHPSYYSIAPGFHYGFGPAYLAPNITGLPSHPLANPDAPYAYGFRSSFRAIPISQTNAAAIDVKLPPTAQLWFQGRLTQQKGSHRFFESPALEPGETYAYQVKAVWTNDKGEKVEQKRTVQVHAGDYVNLDFRKG